MGADCVKVVESRCAPHAAGSVERRRPQVRSVASAVGNKGAKEHRSRSRGTDLGRTKHRYTASQNAMKPIATPNVGVSR